MKGLSLSQKNPFPVRPAKDLCCEYCKVAIVNPYRGIFGLVEEPVTADHKRYYDWDFMTLLERLHELDIECVQEGMQRVIKEDTLKEQGFFKCCLCGAMINDDMGHDPYPVRPETWYGVKRGRCCPDCQTQIVLPARILWGRNNVDKNVVRNLRNSDYEELLDYIAEEMEARAEAEYAAAQSVL